ncbi:MAG: 50S ribosomal protein L10 [Desulfobacterales bacterium]
MKLDEKKRLVEELKEKFSKSKILIVLDYKGLNVEAMNTMRKKLRDSSVECKVIKNTLLVRAADQTEVDRIKDSFKGPSAVVLSYEDPVAPAKVLVEFAKNNKNLEFKKGIMAGKVLEAQDIRALSELPSREVLIAKALSALIGVPTAFVRVLNGVPQGLLNVLTAIKEQKEAA